MKVLETDRLILRRLTADDAAFILELLNDPSWLRAIGDKGVRNLDDARRYIAEGPVAMYLRCGFGLFRVEGKENGVPIGLCGLLKRAELEDVDLGFALLPRFWSRGYAYEAASATLAYARTVPGLARVVAITSANNQASAGLLEKLGMRYEGMRALAVDAEALRLFAVNFPQPI